jgi:hypothetical protein
VHIKAAQFDRLGGQIVRVVVDFISHSADSPESSENIIRIPDS